jgi:hydroxymethylbilane synthase
MPVTVVLGTRGSDLAMTQTEAVAALLRDRAPEVEVVIRTITTEGDRNHRRPLTEFGGRGVFVKALEEALLANDIDIAVHSLKDLPSVLPDGLALGAAPLREDPRDAFVCNMGTLMDLRAGGVVGTGSVRRSAQLRVLRPDLICRDIRGNLPTRLAKLDRGDFDALVLAAAGLRRLGLEGRIAEVFDPEAIVPAPGQGAIGLECRADDRTMRDLLARMEDHDIRRSVDLERAFIAVLGMGCHTPVGAYARMVEDRVRFTGFLDSIDGPRHRETLDLLPEDGPEAVRALASSWCLYGKGNG